MEKADPRLEVVHHPVEALIFAEYNPRKMSKEDAQALKDSIKRFGIVDPLIINRNPDRDMVVIGGHMRLRVAKELGIAEVPCIEVVLDRDRERELNIRLNKAQGEWNWELLDEFFKIEELEGWGFTEKELARLSLDDIETDAEVLPDDDKKTEVKCPNCGVTFCV